MVFMLRVLFCKWDEKSRFTPNNFFIGSLFYCGVITTLDIILIIFFDFSLRLLYVNDMPEELH